MSVSWTSQVISFNSKKFKVGPVQVPQIILSSSARPVSLSIFVILLSFFLKHEHIYVRNVAKSRVTSRDIPPTIHSRSSFIPEVSEVILSQGIIIR